MSKQDDQIFVNGLAAQQSKNLNAIKQLREQLRFVPKNKQDEIKAKIILLDETDLRLRKLLDIAKTEGVLPEEKDSSTWEKRLFKK